MPFISDTASAIKSRFGFKDRSSSSESVPSVRSSPDLLKSASRDNSGQAFAAVRIINELDGSGAGIDGSLLTVPPLSQSFELCEDASFWKDQNVQVIIRLRPLSSSEISQQGHKKCVRQESAQTVTWTGPPESRFTFDIVADENVTQESLFKVAGVPMVENCVGGYNSCMFAYGQTGSGKTHTMLGDIEGGTRRHSVNCGMTPRVFEYLFSRIQKEKEDRTSEKLRFTCKCSFLEIYNEQILDLLDPSSNNLQIREDLKKGVYVENLKEIEVASSRDVLQQLIQGSANRKVAATNMNHASSRSHSVFTCIIESKWESQGVTHHRYARLNLVDLAGSERQKSSGAEGERLKEATNINKSLSTLGLVIMNLVSISNGKSPHVPYRDSKLTFLLQDSLGGNSKTTIIANISPATSCSLETLSTLKFAQRAKFIKNNAIVNEDASGDVIIMRMQIQQLKKEVSRLRSLADGEAEKVDTDALAVSFPGSPSSFKWEGPYGSLSPLTSDKRITHKKDYELALVGAFRREKDKDIALQALTAENQAALQLAKQRGDEIQGLKMRLRFREAGIKRLEAVTSGKTSAEIHLLKEKEEHLKEIEVLRNQVDRNQEVTRFAMENLRLKEEIRRLKSFYEEGEREMMNQQITLLQNKLLEALDWKLMHEAESYTLQDADFYKENEAIVDSGQLISNQKQESPWQSLISEENEFLRVQAIQNQAEIETLVKKLELCLREKEELERHMCDLETNMEELRSGRTVREGMEELQPYALIMEDPMKKAHDPMDLKFMVDAIAVASQREAELSKENNVLTLKVKDLLEENNKLIELYERASSENNSKQPITVDNVEIDTEVAEVTKKKDEAECLRRQLIELHEENEKLLSLYEKAMLERDEFKRMLPNGAIRENTRDLDCPEKLVEVDADDSMVESGHPGLKIQDTKELATYQIDIPVVNLQEEQTCYNGGAEFSESVALKGTPLADDNKNEFSIMGVEPSNLLTERETLLEDLNLVRTKLETVQGKLLNSGVHVNKFRSLEKAFSDLDKIGKELEAMESGIQVKQRQFQSIKILNLETQESKSLTEKKLSAVRYSLFNLCSSMSYFEQREARAVTRVNASLVYLNQKKDEMRNLELGKGEAEACMEKIQQAEAELKNNLTLLKSNLKSKLEEENQRQEEGKVLFSIDNIDKVRCLGGKATDLLKSEEQKAKLQSEIKLYREKLVAIKGESLIMSDKLSKIETQIKATQTEMEKGTKSMNEMKLALASIQQEKETLAEITEKGRAEIENLVMEYHQHVFDEELKKVEIQTTEEEIKLELRRIKDLQAVRAAADEKKNKLLDNKTCDSSFLSGKMEQELEAIEACVMEAKILLEDVASNSM